MVTALPRLVIGAPSSGAGKTTVATGLMAAFTAKGLVVSPHKVGPDYIDPAYHALAAGRPGRNLDPWLVGEDLIAPLLLHGAAGADIAVIEGVMGLFDGSATPGAGPATATDTGVGTATGLGTGVRTATGVGAGAGAGMGTGAGMGMGAGTDLMTGVGGGTGPMAVAGADTDLASTAHVARLLDAPVVLVVDVSGQGRSVAALVHGFMSFDTRVRVGGVVLNRVGSPRHERICRDALAETGVEVFGAIPRTGVAATPARHLGLIPPAERAGAATEAVAAMGELVAATCDLAALVRLAHTAPRLTASPWNPHEALAANLHEALAARPHPSHVDASQDVIRDVVASARGGVRDVDGVPGVAGGLDGVPVPGVMRGQDRAPAPEVVVAVAGGKAFTFGYAEQAELVQAAGGIVVPFDPLRDERLPAGTRAVLLPGGFPEVYAAELSANEPLRRAISAFAGPIVAECAGLLYLCRELDGRPMCGLVDATAAMTDRLTLGYRAAVAVRDSVVTREGERYRGHEFHRTRITPAAGPVTSADSSPKGVTPAPSSGRAPVPLSGMASSSLSGMASASLSGVVASASLSGMASAPLPGAAREPLFRWRGGADGYGGPRLAASYLHLHWAGSPYLAARLVAGALR
ncbi:cobyrinate a,c-diamide synthase [Sphaerisporangium sp. NPDC005288]|uniref:cobyrinate a,c-diamide synthase n=1 Tax=Sphaerisporangium sp. NPDC005288 TaxID=3155114 RepID=UPI0033BA16CE